MSRRSKLIERILKDNEQYLSKLSKCFIQAEKLDDSEALKNIFLIFKDLINIADMRFYEVLVSEKHYQTVFGALEYNNEVNNSHTDMEFRNVSPFILLNI
jgi:hypothetical protein